MNFQSYESCSRPTSRVLRPPGGGGSNIFGASDPPTQKSTKPEPTLPVEEVKAPVPEEEVSTANTNVPVRRDPITGEVIGNVVKEEKEVDKENNDNESKSVSDPLKQYEPHLGPQKNFSGLRCAQPPGGKSNIMFG